MKSIDKIYEKIKTPYKYGAVIKIEGLKIDSPVIFKCDGKFYMSFVGIDSECKGGYNTYIAESDNLTDWNNYRKIMGKSNDWDAVQCGGYAQFIDNEFGGSNEIKKINGKYIFAYIGGNLKGYETDPLSMGLAKTDVFTDNDKFIRNVEPI